MQELFLLKKRGREGRKEEGNREKEQGRKGEGEEGRKRN